MKKLGDKLWCIVFGKPVYVQSGETFLPLKFPLGIYEGTIIEIERNESGKVYRLSFDEISIDQISINSFLFYIGSGSKNLWEENKFETKEEAEKYYRNFLAKYKKQIKGILEKNKILSESYEKKIISLNESNILISELLEKLKE